jgi:hypothetical protein
MEIFGHSIVFYCNKPMSMAVWLKGQREVPNLAARFSGQEKQVVV